MPAASTTPYLVSVTMNRPSPTAPNSHSSPGFTDLDGMSSTQRMPYLSPEERLSALADGELDAASEAALWRDDSELLADTWSRYQLIGDALRGSRPQLANVARVASVMLQVHEERAALAGAVTPEPMTAPEWAPAHAPAQRAPAAVEVLVGAPHDAANDAVFRWKMLAGFASLAAVVAVAWNMSVAVDTTGPQLAQAPAANAVAAVVAASVPASTETGVSAQGTPMPAASTEAVPAVLAEAQQGPVLRDARLEELMAAHRQAGGMSALQMPAGFLRNAAFDLPEGQR